MAHGRSVPEEDSVGIDLVVKGKSPSAASPRKAHLDGTVSYD